MLYAHHPVWFNPHLILVQEKKVNIKETKYLHAEVDGAVRRCDGRRELRGW